MSTRAQGVATRTATAALVALAVACAVAPARARAGCSAHVVTPADAPAAAAQLDLLLPHPDSGPTAVAPASGAMPGGRRPCDGPSCSGRRSQPLPIPTVSAAERFDDQGLPPSLPTLAPRDPGGRVPTETPGRATHRGPTVHRPPRG